MTLCLVAGQGHLPSLVADAIAPEMIATLDGFEPDELKVDRTFRIETLGSFIADLQAAGIRQVCFAGAMRRPALESGKVDAATLPLLPKMLRVMGQGDDAALRLVLSLFTDAGITPVAAHDLVPDLLPHAGVAVGKLGKTTEADAIRAAAIVAAMGQADVGQACIVASGQALATEALPGTDWMLDSLIAARGGGPLGKPLPAGGLLFKAPKPDQDRRVDLPAIGPETIHRAARAGLEGVVIELGGVIVLEAPKTMDTARNLGLFVWVRPA